eukprot:763089-Hanusia_phi.AAC.2
MPVKHGKHAEGALARPALTLLRHQALPGAPCADEVGDDNDGIFHVLPPPLRQDKFEFAVPGILCPFSRTSCCKMQHGRRALERVGEAKNAGAQRASLLLLPPPPHRAQTIRLERRAPASDSFHLLYKVKLPHGLPAELVVLPHFRRDALPKPGAILPDHACERLLLERRVGPLEAAVHQDDPVKLDLHAL